VNGSHTKSSHCAVKEWHHNKAFLLGEKNTANVQLVEPLNIFLPPLHIKLGLIKISAKAMN
jgi:hypothetical protein